MDASSANNGNKNESDVIIITYFDYRSSKRPIGVIPK